MRYPALPLVQQQLIDLIIKQQPEFILNLSILSLYSLTKASLCLLIEFVCKKIRTLLSFFKKLKVCKFGVC